jgi:hypothetical protein
VVAVSELRVRCATLISAKEPRGVPSLFGSKRRAQAGLSDRKGQVLNDDDDPGTGLMSEVSQNDSNQLLTMVMQFHNSARAEILQRIGNRDTALFIFLAGSATLFSISARQTLRPALYAIPILGLGVSQVYSQHSTVIGAIGRYLGYELHSWLYRNYPNQNIPPQWIQFRVRPPRPAREQCAVHDVACSDVEFIGLGT